MQRNYTESTDRWPSGWTPFHISLQPLHFPSSALTVFPSSRSAILVNMLVESSWNVMAHGDAREGKWRGNWRMEWVASTFHTTSEHGVASITTADAHNTAASSRLNWRPHRFKWTRPFRLKTKSGFCACAITFQLASTTLTVGNLMILSKNSVLAGCCASVCFTFAGEHFSQCLYCTYRSCSYNQYITPPMHFVIQHTWHT